MKNINLRTIQLTIFLCINSGFAAFYVEPALETGSYSGANVDSVAVWTSPDGDAIPSLLFVTEKELDRIEVWDASTGLPYEVQHFLGGEPDSAEPGQFNRPNGVWILNHVPFKDTFHDILLVTDRYNDRVQIFRLPELAYFGEFAGDELDNCYGLASYHDGVDFFVFVSDAVESGKFKKYRLLEDGEYLGAELVSTFGEEDGPGAFRSGVESLIADPYHNRLHICGDEGGDFIHVYDLAGIYTGTTYGEPEFQNDQEGIALYDAGSGRGYIVVSDQYSGATEFEVFDRETLASLGHFECPAGADSVTENTDGTYLCQRPLNGFPNGAFFAINDDENVHIYDWTDIAEAMNLEIAALDRPFPLGGYSSEHSAQRSLWFNDGSWWGALQCSDGFGIFRLEDGLFFFQALIDSSPPRHAAATQFNEELLVLAAGDTKKLHRLSYNAGKREYNSIGDPVALDFAGTSNVSIACHENRVWISWVESIEDKGPRLMVSWSSPGDALSWKGEGIELGDAAAVCPELVPFEGGIGVLWADTNGACVSFHPDGSSPETWSEAVSFSEGTIEGISGTTVGSDLVAACSGPTGGAIWLCSIENGCAELESLPQDAVNPVLAVDRASNELFLIYVRGQNNLTVCRKENLEKPLGVPKAVSAWPGVAFGRPCSVREVPVGVQDLVVVAQGNDGQGYFGRLHLNGAADINAPITMQHDPAPNELIVQQDRRLFFRITDDFSGVDKTTLRVFMNDMIIAPQVKGVPRNLLVESSIPSEIKGVVSVRIEAEDLSDPPHVMTPFEYIFTVNEEQARFRRGDVNGDGTVDISDPINLLIFLFGELNTLKCMQSADSNIDDTVNISDAVFLLSFLFTHGAQIPEPYPECGISPVSSDLTCKTYPLCE